MTEGGTLGNGLFTAAHPSVRPSGWQRLDALPFHLGPRAPDSLVSLLVAGPSPKTCVACGRRIAPSEVYYRFTLVLQGEQDVLDASGSGSGDELAAILRQLEEGPQDPREWEEQIHWERSGVICTACRAVVMRTLAGPSGDAEPH
jgi:hypothetical protein